MPRYHGSKEHPAREDIATLSMVIEQSRSSMQPARNNVGRQQQSLRRRRRYRYSRNPIVSSPQYQAYRERQSRDSNKDDAKWPEILEVAFLDGNILFKTSAPLLIR